MSERGRSKTRSLINETTPMLRVKHLLVQGSARPRDRHPGLPRHNNVTIRMIETRAECMKTQHDVRNYLAMKELLLWAAFKTQA